jgi:hypothetical protein
VCSRWTNQAVDAISRTWNNHYANGKQVEVTGFKRSKFISHEGLKRMAYTGNGRRYYNSEEFIVKSLKDKLMCLIQENDNTEINAEYNSVKYEHTAYMNINNSNMIC